MKGRDMKYRMIHNELHWRVDCSNWPGHSFVEVKTKKGQVPTEWPLCKECAAKEAAASERKLQRRKPSSSS